MGAANTETDATDLHGRFPAQAGRRAALLVGGAAVLYLNGLRPWLLPGVYDNVTYLVAAREIARAGTFSFQGEPITTLAPGLSFALSLLARAGVLGIGSAKVLVLACALGCLALALRHLEEEGNARPWWSCALFAACPVSLSLGVSILSEWPFLLLAFAFLRLARRLEESPTVAAAVAAGLVLGAASLARWVGLTLLAALAAQAVLALRRRSGRAFGRVLPEALAATLGVAVFLGWQLHQHALWVDAATPARAPDDAFTLTDQSFGLHLVPRLRVAWSVTDVLWKGDTLVRRLELGSPWHDLALLPALLVAVGWVAHLRRRGPRPADAWQAAYLALMLTTTWPVTRLLFVLGPFLFSHAIGGARVLATPLVRRLGPRRSSWLAVAGLAGWLAWLGALDGYFLTRGNGRTHAGLSPLVTRREDDFYLGPWRDARLAARVMAADPTRGGVAVPPIAFRYVHVWTGRSTRGPAAGPVRYRLDLPGAPAQWDESDGSWREAWRHDDAVLWVREPPPAGAPAATPAAPVLAAPRDATP